MKFHNKLFQLRKEAGLTQLELSEAINVSRQAISKWEMGNAIPDIDNMISLSKLFSVSIDYLVTDGIVSDSIEATPTLQKKNNTKKILIISIGISTIVIIFLGIGIISKTLASMIIMLSIIIFSCLIYFILRWLFILSSMRNK